MSTTSSRPTVTAIVKSYTSSFEMCITVTPLSGADFLLIFEAFFAEIESKYL